MVAALDDVDRVDLNIAEMLDSGAGRLRSVAKGRRGVETLRSKPEAPGVERRKRDRLGYGARQELSCHCEQSERGHRQNFSTHGLSSTSHVQALRGCRSTWR